MSKEIRAFTGTVEMRADEEGKKTIRGYALKIDDEFVKGKQIHRDMGGYGILAPEINEKGE